MNGEPDRGVVALRGAVHPQRLDDGDHWLAVADLIAGDLADGARQADAVHIVQRDWRGRFAQVVWNTQGTALTAFRSEEHTSELQSLMRISYAVFCLKKKKNR